MSKKLWRTKGQCKFVHCDIKAGIVALGETDRSFLMSEREKQSHKPSPTTDTGDTRATRDGRAASGWPAGSCVPSTEAGTGASCPGDAGLGGGGRDDDAGGDRWPRLVSPQLESTRDLPESLKRIFFTP